MFRKAPASRSTPVATRVTPRGTRGIGAVPAFLAGSAAGFLLASVVTGRGRRDPEAAAAAWSLAGGWAQLAEAWQEMLDSWMTAMERAPRAVDLAALAERLRALPGGESVTVRLLDSGIVEVAGDLPAAEDHARALLDAVAREAGVRVVLNRIWVGAESPSTTHPDRD